MVPITLWLVPIGAHVSSAGGLWAAADRAVAIGAEVLQCFVQSPRAWKPTDHDGADLHKVAPASPVPVFVHVTYLVNLASADPDLRERSVQSLASQYATACRAGAQGVVLHPGSYKGSTRDEGITAAADGIRAALGAAERDLGKPGEAAVLLENSAGAGSSLCRSIEELAALRQACGSEPRIGVCLDTQHLWASGTEYSEPSGVESVVRLVRELIGMENLRLLHLNDSKVALGAGRDRHENLGAGHIGRRALGLLLGHPGLASIPAVLEVPGPNGKGPSAQDVIQAREIYAEGCQMWAAG